MSVAEQFYDSVEDMAAYDHRLPPPIIVAPMYSGVPYSTSNPLEGYFMKKGPGYVDPQSYRRPNTRLAELWKSQGPPAHAAPWLHGGRDPREIALELEMASRKKLAAAAAGGDAISSTQQVLVDETTRTGAVVPITDHPRWTGGLDDQPLESVDANFDSTEIARAERMRS